MSRCAHQHVISIVRIDQDFCDVLAVLQPDVGPVLASIGRFIYAIADRNAVAHPRLAAAHPDRLRIRRINAYRADRLHALAIKYGLVRSSAVHRLPHASTGRPYENRNATVLLDGVHRSDTPTHRRRTDVARRQSGYSGGVELVTRLGVGRAGPKHETYNPKEHAQLRQKRKMTASRIHRFVSSLRFKISPTPGDQ